jgi:exonuclease SbcC
MIESISLRGFKSFPATRKVTVVFTQGVNRISGRNASGKTSLLEAILFGLYGEVPGVNKQDLVPLDGSSLWVTIKIKSPLTGQGATIRREGGLTKEGGFRTTKALMTVAGENYVYSRERDIQSRLRELLGIGRNTFLNVVYAQQKDFIEILNPNRNRMDGILGLTAPSEVKEQFREVKRILGERGRISEKGTFQERIRNANELISSGEKQLKVMKARRTELEKGLEEMKIQLLSNKGKVNDLEIFLNELKHLEDFQNEIEKLELLQEERIKDLEYTQSVLGDSPEKLLDELRTQMIGFKSTEERLKRLITSELDKERSVLSGEISRLCHQLDEHMTFKNKGFTNCPTCGQEINWKLIEDDLKRWREDHAVKSQQLKSLESEIETIQRQAKISQNKWIKAEREVSEIETLMVRLKDQKRALERIRKRGFEIASRFEAESEIILKKVENELGISFVSAIVASSKLEDRLEKERRELGVLQREVGNREGQLKYADRRQKDVNERIEIQNKILKETRIALNHIIEYEAKLIALDKTQALYDEYGKHLRDNTLSQLEYQTYQYFMRLTDQQLYGACRIDRERYTLEVYPLGGLSSIAAWRAGGGHQSLFALAERLALLRVMGFPHLLILDEPTDAVDSENIPQLLEYIAKGSREIGQVLLVTHHGYGEEEGVNLIRVMKDGRESRIIQEFTSE